MKIIRVLGWLAIGTLVANCSGAEENATNSAGPEAEASPTVVAGEGPAIRAQAAALFEVVPAVAPELADNPLTDEKIELGKMLYFEPRLSSSWLISCNTCHNLSLGGIDLMETSIGHGWQKGPRNAPTVLNAVFNLAQFWDGRAADLEEQAKGPVQASVEMASDPDRAVATLRSIPEYRELFAKAFPGEGEPVTFDNMARAIEAFEATLVTPGSPFDRWLAGDEAAMSEMQVKGLEIFVSKGCTGCHAGVNFGGQGYFPFGVVQAPSDEIRPVGDLGRFSVTNTEADQYVFKSPSLRNIEITAPYFHSGKVWSLKEAVSIMGSAQLGAVLTPGEVDAIEAFLEALTGRQPQVEYPVLPPHTADTPLPDVGVPTAAAPH
jgi:cytochrome c peroxidase